MRVDKCISTFSNGNVVDCIGIKFKTGFVKFRAKAFAGREVDWAHTLHKHGDAEEIHFFFVDENVSRRLPLRLENVGVNNPLLRERTSFIKA